MKAARAPITLYQSTGQSGPKLSVIQALLFAKCLRRGAPTKGECLLKPQTFAHIFSANARSLQELFQRMPDVTIC